MDTGDAAASSVEIKAKKPKFTTHKVVNSKNFTTANITEVPQEYTCPKVTGEVTYNGKEDFPFIQTRAKNNGQIRALEARPIRRRRQRESMPACLWPN